MPPLNPATLIGWHLPKRAFKQTNNKNTWEINRVKYTNKPRPGLLAKKGTPRKISQFLQGFCWAAARGEAPPARALPAAGCGSPCGSRGRRGRGAPPEPSPCSAACSKRKHSRDFCRFGLRLPGPAGRLGVPADQQGWLRCRLWPLKH